MSKVVMTYTDYAALPDDGRRYELHDGEIEVTPAPSTKHQTVVKNLLFLLEGYLREHRIGTLLQAPVDLILSETTVLQPDLLVVLRGRESLITDRGIEGPPDLVVEVLSPGTASRDRKSKFQLYARHGVSHYWIVDPNARRLEAYGIMSTGYALSGVLEGEGELSSDLFPGLVLRGSAIWV